MPTRAHAHASRCAFGRVTNASRRSEPARVGHLHALRYVRPSKHAWACRVCKSAIVCALCSSNAKTIRGAATYSASKPLVLLLNFGPVNRRGGNGHEFVLYEYTLNKFVQKICPFRFIYSFRRHFSDRVESSALNANHLKEKRGNCIIRPTTS